MPGEDHGADGQGKPDFLSREPQPTEGIACHGRGEYGADDTGNKNFHGVGEIHQRFKILEGFDVVVPTPGAGEEARREDEDLRVAHEGGTEHPVQRYDTDGRTREKDHVKDHGCGAELFPFPGQINPCHRNTPSFQRTGK